ncbi:hypothetical protein RSP799_16085 [Ralstonia solanacearum]|nr:hypothetical protein RSP799_16085 [Ralstonia solanacearum]
MLHCIREANRFFVTSPLNHVIKCFSVLRVKSLQMLEYAKYDPAQSFECNVLIKAFSVSFFTKTVTFIQLQMDYRNDGASTQLPRGGIDSAYVETQPIIVALAVRKDAHAVAVDSNPGLVVKPRLDLRGAACRVENLRPSVVTINTPFNWANPFQLFRAQ